MHLRASPLVVCVVVAAASVLASSCGDPVHDAAVAALGAEDPDVDPGPLHRPGQPCLTCHDGNHGKARAMSVAGTIFRDEDHALPMNGIDVLLVDSAHRSVSTTTNCAGNFFLYPDEYAPALPLWASVQREASRIDMDSPMNRDGNCNGCHRPQKSPMSAGFVFAETDPDVASTLPTGCGAR